MSNYPDDLRYTKDHEWARVEGTKATFGITGFAVEHLGDITQVELPREGDSVQQGEIMGTVESVKAVSDVFAPLSGKVIRVNDPLTNSPEYVNQDPYDDGWMIQVELKDAAEAKGLMDAAAYVQYLKEKEAE